MALKNLMVHLDQGARSEVRLGLAVSLARQHQAHLVGVFGQRAQPAQVGVVAIWPSKEYSEAAAAAEAAFERASTGLPGAVWHDINRGSDAELIRHITDFARYSDLMLLGQHDDQVRSFVPAELPDEIVVNSGRPVLIVEDVGIMDMLLNRVTDRGADLLVMGGHGQIGFPFVSRGAGTRHILRQMTVPVLMSN